VVTAIGWLGGLGIRGLDGAGLDAGGFDGGGFDKPCCSCAAAGSTPPIMIASTTSVMANPEIKLRCMAGRILVVIAMRALRRSGAKSYLMILFAPALSKPDFFPTAIRDPLTL